MNTFNDLLVHITVSWFLGAIDEGDRHLINCAVVAGDINEDQYLVLIDMIPCNYEVTWK